MSKRDVLSYAKALVRAGVMERPLWMMAVERTPPLPLGKPGKRPPRIDFPEDELIEAYYRRHPEARLEPIDLSSFEPPTARRFALRQLELIQKSGMNKRRAARVVEREFAAQRQMDAAGGATPQSIIDQIQAEEELHLQQALRQYAQTHGPVLVRQHAKEVSEAHFVRPPFGPMGERKSFAERNGQQRQQQQQQQRGPRQPQGPQAAKQAQVQPQPQPQPKLQAS